MKSLVHVVDDDAAVRGGLKWFFESAGLAAEVYVGAEDFLARYTPGEVAECVVLDEAHAVQSTLSRRRHQNFWGEAAALRSRERVAVQV